MSELGNSFTRWCFAFALAVANLGWLIDEGMAQQASAASVVPEVAYAVQGWTDADRNIFYTTSQGSHMMPYAWFKALRQADVDQPFAADQLQRYGYLPNSVSASNPEGLPVGFVIDGTSGQIGMTCAACHTAQLEYKKDGVTRASRLDGAPANADFEQFLIDLRDASLATLMQPARLDAFVRAVLAGGYTAKKAAQLKDGFAKWVAQFGEFMDKSLPTGTLWGRGRLDAFGMIFNRVAARDLGVVGNFKTANAPVSYPFLWDASRQDRTQWNGGVPNGLYIQALGRNTGEVFGVFGDFAPRRLVAPGLLPAVIDYHGNSVKFAGLQTLEEKIVALRPPPWPREIFGLNDALVEPGKPLYDKYCGECHGVQVSPDLPGLWRTPVKAVGTDSKMASNSALQSDAGPLTGALMAPPAIGARIAKMAKTADLLGNVVVGSLIAEALIPPVPSPPKLMQSGVFRALRRDFAEHLPDENLDALLDEKLSLKARSDAMNNIRAFINMRLSNMFNPPPNPDGPAYEARVLGGIWATAPYLHNGSVPNLWELLKPPGDRKANFMVGSRVFDPTDVGYATDETPFKNGVFTADLANGNGNGGHDFGTGLTDEERWQIIEYMKTL
jgi:hypothetical protein